MAFVLITDMLSFFCGLGAATFATAANRTRYVGVLVLGFVGAVLWSRFQRVPEPAWIGLIAAIIGILCVLRPEDSTVAAAAAALAGVLGASLASVLYASGLSALPAIALAAAGPLASACFTRMRPSFAPVRLREEALVVISIFGVVVAALPEIDAGWSSALVLNRQGVSSMNPAIGAWVFLLSAASLTLGGLHSLWRRR
jgi:hypothetical protein